MMHAKGGEDRGALDFSALPEGPVTIVLATFGYRRVVREWIAHAQRAGVHHYRIVCMDERVLRELRNERGEHRAVAYHDLVPDVAHVDIDTLPDLEARVRLLTALRMKLFRRLAAEHDFVHSDVDAFWHRDLRPWLARQRDYDLLFSQGTVHSREHFNAHRFTLCAGFFLARATSATRAFLASVEAADERPWTDQGGIGRALLDRACRWRVEQPVAVLRTMPRSADLYVSQSSWFRAPLGGALLGRLLAMPWSARVTRRALRLIKLQAMITSCTMMRGTCADGLRVGVIPMHLVERISLGAPMVYVSHTRSNAPKWRRPHVEGIQRGGGERANRSDNGSRGRGDASLKRKQAAAPVRRKQET